MAEGKSIIRHCLNCEKQYKVYRPHQIFCSIRCGGQYRKKEEKKHQAEAYQKMLKVKGDWSFQ